MELSSDFKNELNTSHQITNGDGNMNESKYVIKHNDSPDIKGIEGFLSECLRNDALTYNYLLRGLKSNNNVCTYEAYENERLVGVITAWKTEFHPYCTYFSMATELQFNYEIESLLIESLYNIKGIEYPLQTSVWETAYRHKTFFEKNEFTEIRRTYMPVIRSFIVDVKKAFADILTQDLTVIDFKCIKNNQNLKISLINLIKENYSKIHAENPLGEHNQDKWEKLIFNEDVVQEGSYIVLINDEIIAYSLLHYSDTSSKYEFGWRGTSEKADISFVLLLTAHQLNFAEANGVEFIEAEVDTTDYFSIEMLKFFPFSPAPTLLTLQRRE